MSNCYSYWKYFPQIQIGLTCTQLDNLINFKLGNQVGEIRLFFIYCQRFEMDIWRGNEDFIYVEDQVWK